MKGKKFIIGISCILSIVSLSNIYYYSYTDNYYRWKVNYLNKNESIANYIKENYKDNSLIVQEGDRAWGYTQLLYGRNIYCTNIYKPAELIKIAQNSNKRFIILIDTESSGWDKKEQSVLIYDIINEDLYSLYYDNNVIEKQLCEKEIILSSLVDQNWNKGISNYEPKLLVENTFKNKYSLKNGRSIQIGRDKIRINTIQETDDWITVECDIKDYLELFQNQSILKVIDE